MVKKVSKLLDKKLKGKIENQLGDKADTIGIGLILFSLNIPVINKVIEKAWQWGQKRRQQKTNQPVYQYQPKQPTAFNINELPEIKINEPVGQEPKTTN